MTLSQRLLVAITLLFLLLPTHNATAQDYLPALLELLLEQQSDTPIVVHPQAGMHIPEPLASGTGAPPFGFYRYLPIDFTLDQRRKFPLLLFLHGLGEVGNGTSELSRVLRNGPPKMVERGVDFPAVVISPQVTIGSWQQQRNGFDIPADLHRLVSYVVARYNIDPNRIYVTGLSLGGGGAWNYARLYNEEVAAVVPICGVGTNGTMINKLKNMGVWAFHSIDDNVVASRNTIRQMNLIAGTTLDGANGVMNDYPDDGTNQIASLVNGDWQWNSGTYSGSGGTRFTLFPDASHNSWSRAYNENGTIDTPMWQWLFEQQRGSE